MSTVPTHIETKYVPRLKEQFRKFAEMATAIDLDPSLMNDKSFQSKAEDFRREMDDLYAEFENDGGTEEHWNTLAPAVHYGKYGPY